MKVKANRSLVFKGQVQKSQLLLEQQAGFTGPGRGTKALYNLEDKTRNQRSREQGKGSNN